MDQHLGPQSVYQLFAENLRRQCNRFESIAAFCRKSGINRQQFNRYLAGQNLPNPGSLKKICTTLGVSEVSLFESRSPQSDATTRIAAAELVALRTFTQGLPPLGLSTLAAAASSLQGSTDIQDRIQSGVYHAYMPMAGYPGQLLRAVIKVSQVGGLTVFTRRTSFRTKTSGSDGTTVGRHVGLVITDAYATIFCAVNKIYPHEISVMRVLHSISSREAPKLGLSMVRSPFGDLACKVVLHWMGRGTFAERKALSLMGITEIGDASLPAVIANMLPNEPCDAQRHDYLEVNEILQAHQQMNLQPRAKPGQT